VRSQTGVILALLAAAGVAWRVTADRMAGMDAGPGTDLGGLGWFTGAWAVMMAAMMLPSLAPTAAVYAALTRRREPIRPALFIGGYLLVWGVAGIVAYGVYAVGKTEFGRDLAPCERAVNRPGACLRVAAHRGRATFGCTSWLRLRATNGCASMKEVGIVPESVEREVLI
jgi:predicted metal-binding integral membrane protein DUF2182